MSLRRRRDALLDRAGRDMQRALVEVAAARTELDIAVVELTEVLEGNQNDRP